MNFNAALARGARRLLAGCGVALVGIVAAAPAAAQSIAAGNTYFNDPTKCAGCHTGGPGGSIPAALNAANASNIITHALNGGMAALSPTATELTSLGLYINSVLPSPSPNNGSVPFNPGGASFTTLATNVVFPTAYGALNTLQSVAAPTKGVMSFSGNSIRYTPNACALGGDTFQYRGSGPGGNTNTRTGTVTIQNPTTPPTIGTAAPPGGQTGVAYSHNVNVTACESLITYSISAGALPPGLTISPSTGVISGTPTTQGTFNGTIRAAYTAVPALFDSQAFSITITLGPPNITSAATAANAAVGAPYPGYTITATNSPTLFGASGLPPGLTVNTSNGVISGTPTDASASPYVANVSATNATGTDNQSVTFNVVPAVSSPATANGQTQVSFTYSITEGPGPAYTTHSASPLPPGLSLNASTGVISGTPTTIGTTLVTVTGTTAFGGTSAPFTLTINITLGPPAITSPLAASGGVTIPFNYQITATNSPTSFNATGLPAGLTVNTSTGAITGAPSAGTGGTHMVAISASNATGTGNATLTLTIAESPPVITSAGTATGTTGAAFAYQIAATNGPTSFSATGLPPGLAVNTSTGSISGTPTTPGTFNATMTAANGAGSDTKPLVFTIALGPPVITSSATAGGADGFPFSYQITATNNPTTYGASGLPPGLTVNPATGLISGTPTATGTFNATISATNATATATQALTITLGVGVPVITGPTSASGATGLAFLFQVTATNSPTGFNATGLPPGLTMNTTTGRITGTPTTAGTYTLNLSATNATGTGTRALTVTISLRPPVISTGTTATGVIGVNFAYQIQASNGATGFSASGLPPGLALDTASGLISGVPTASGAYPVTVGVTNSAGTTTFTLTITIGLVAPTAGNTAVDVPFQQATPITLPVTGESVTITIVTLPEHGLVSVNPGSAVVTYTPAMNYSGPDSFTYTAANSAGTTAAFTVSITVAESPPVAGAATVIVPINTATTFSMTHYVAGSGLSGVAIQSGAAHGTVTVNGLEVTYTPRTDYFGPDAFTYVAFGKLGASSPATITIAVVGRPDPSADRDVVGLVDAQNQAARRFAGAQVANYQRRMETLHRGAPEPGPAASAAASGPAKAPDSRTAARQAEDTGYRFVPVALVSTLMQAATSRSVEVPGGNGAPGAAGETGFWAGGSLNFGRRDANGERSGLEFNTDGISLGVDRRFGERLVLGVGAGFARDDTDIGSAGTRSKATGASIAAYGSYQPTPRTFIDALLGYGELRFDSDRYVTAVDDFASARRKGRQFFGAVIAGYEHRRENLLVSPYGRLEFSADRLDAVSESGAGDYALRFARQNQRAAQGAVGVRAESKHETDFGWAVPRVRAEYRREFEGDRAAGLAYANLFGGAEYTVTPAGTSRNSLLLGIGSDFVFRGGLRVGIDYQAQRASGAANLQGVRILVSQELDARGVPGWRWEPTMLKYPVNVDAGYTWDDNVNRSRDPGERRADNVFGLGLNMTRHWPLRADMRVQLTGLVSGEKFDRHAGLGRFSGGAQAELQYRSSGAFDATTFSAVGRALYEQYESHLRTGPRYFLGLNARRALTDRIELFAEIGANARYGRSDVFNWRDYAAKLNLDYSLGRKGIVYLSGEYRRGDTVSSGRPSLVNVAVAEVFAPDDAFDGLDFNAYRFDARSILTTVGYNYPLGGRDAIDFSWRRVQSTPIKRPAFDFSGSRRYIDNQYSIVYLMRF